MKSYLFIGIDISKATLDVCILSGFMETYYHEFSNSSTGFTGLLKWLKEKSESIAVEDWRVCMENTGIYSLELNCFLDER